MIYAFAIGFLYNAVAAERRGAEDTVILTDGLIGGFWAVLGWGAILWLLG